MNLIVCLDNGGGMAFCSRRQSRDSVLCRNIIGLTNGKTLFVSPYTAGLFENGFTADSNFLKTAGKGDFCFTELDNPAPFADKIENIIVYRWNRDYPADLYFPQSLLKSRKLLEKTDFAGSSHEKITREVYVK